MIRRAALPLLKRRLASSPAVALLGARQTGKTTLAKSMAGRYFDLEQPEDRLRLDLTWEEVVSSPELVILDEAQAWPEVFPRLRGAIDRDRRRNGRFLVLGSVSPSMMRQASESLAGRLALCELTPLLVSELPSGKETAAWLKGGYPAGGVLGRREVFPAWQGDYLEILAQRDLPNWGLSSRPALTRRLFKMLALSHGNVWNASEIGRSLGLNYHTVNSYLEYVQGAYLVRFLPPFHGNLRKRLVKSPKVFWRDSGLLHALLGVSTFDSLLVQPWVGASWEGWVIEQILSHLGSRGKRHEAFYLRTADGEELDLVLDLEGKRWAIEIKLTTAPSDADLARLDRLADLIRADARCLISRTRTHAGTAHRSSTNLPSVLRRLA